MVAICAGSVALAFALFGKLALERVHPLDQFTACAASPDLGIFDRFRTFQGPCTYLCDSSGSLSGSFYSVLSHWWENEQRGHLFGYWFWS